LRRHGLGCFAERSRLANWESGQDHVALYLYNGNEYLEGMLGACKARAASFNVNYRYVDEELIYLFQNADARAVVYHAAFAPTLERIRSKLSNVALWLQVADESGNPTLPGALDYETALAEASPAPPPDDLSPDDLYILYTGGTTGMPKGVLWRQEDIYFAALPAPPFMHGASQWVVFNMWHVGGTVIIQSNPQHLDADDIWGTIERERVNALTIVGDAYARPLLDQLNRKDYDLASLTLFTSGGAILTADALHFRRRDPDRGGQGRGPRTDPESSDSRCARLVGERCTGVPDLERRRQGEHR
jgi:fatty-acyl-CoA synthase